MVWVLNSEKSIGGHTPELLGSPQVIAESGRSSLRFNGSTDGLIVPVNPIQGQKQFTIQVLFRPESGGPEEQRFLHIEDERASRALLETRLFNNQWALDAFVLSGDSRLVLYDRTKLHPADQWTWVAMTYDGGTLTSYVNGVKELEGSVYFPPTEAGKISLGVRQNKVYWYKGVISQVWFHKTALRPEDLQRDPNPRK